MTNSPPLTDQINELRETYRQELDRGKRDLEEMERLLRQTQAEADKLGQREMSVGSQMRNVQANLDRFSKEDIRGVFVMAQEVQVRLVSIRGQVEGLQDRQKRLRERQTELNTLLDILDNVNPEPKANQVTFQTDDNQDTLIGEVIQAQEKERLRISLQMHDGPAQMLSNLILRAEICERMIDRDVAQAKSELGALRKAINTVLQDTRRFIFDLRPMILDDLGLIPTLRRYAQDFSEKWKVDVSIAVQNLDTRLPRHYEVALFRFVQEALNNVQKHASAGSARVVVDGLGNQVQVMIEDDGSGFNINEAMTEGRGHRNMGFAVMKQQTETLLKGQLGIESVPGRGTRVIASVPLPAGLAA